MDLDSRQRDFRFVQDNEENACVAKQNEKECNDVMNGIVVALTTLKAAHRAICA